MNKYILVKRIFYTIIIILLPIFVYAQNTIQETVDEDNITINQNQVSLSEELDEFETNIFNLANNIVDTTLDDVSININRNNTRNWNVGNAISNITDSLAGVLNTGITTAGTVLNTGITTTGSVANTTITTLPDTLNIIMDLLVATQEQLHELEDSIGESMHYFLDTNILKIFRDAIATRFGTLAFGGAGSVGRALVGDVSGSESNNNDLSNEDIIIMYEMDGNRDGKITIREMRQAVKSDRKNLPVIQRVFNTLTRKDMLLARQDRRNYNRNNRDNIIIGGSDYVYTPSDNRDSSDRRNDTGRCSVRDNGSGGTGGVDGSSLGGSNDTGTDSDIDNGRGGTGRLGVGGTGIGIGRDNGRGGTGRLGVGGTGRDDYDNIIPNDNEREQVDCDKIVHDFVITCSERAGNYKIIELEETSGWTLSSDELIETLVPEYHIPRYSGDNAGIFYSTDILASSYNIPTGVYYMLGHNRQSKIYDFLGPGDTYTETYVNTVGRWEDIESTILGDEYYNNTDSCRFSDVPKACFVNKNDNTDVAIFYLLEGACGENRKNDGIAEFYYTCNNVDNTQNNVIDPAIFDDSSSVLEFDYDEISTIPDIPRLPTIEDIVINRGVDIGQRGGVLPGTSNIPNIKIPIGVLDWLLKSFDPGIGNYPPNSPQQINNCNTIIHDFITNCAMQIPNPGIGERIIQLENSMNGYMTHVEMYDAFVPQWRDGGAALVPETFYNRTNIPVGITYLAAQSRPVSKNAPPGADSVLGMLSALFGDNIVVYPEQPKLCYRNTPTDIIINYDLTDKNEAFTPTGWQAIYYTCEKIEGYVPVINVN